MTGRRFCLIGILVAVMASVSPVRAAGTVTVTTADVGGGVTRVTVAWVSTAGGAVSANAFAVPRGEILQVKFVPDSGGTQPTDLYDVTLVDSASVDYLTGLGANLSNATATISAPKLNSAFRAFVDGTATLDLVVANAGSAKGGTVILWIGR